MTPSLAQPPDLEERKGGEASSLRRVTSMSLWGESVPFGPVWVLWTEGGFPLQGEQAPPYLQVETRTPGSVGITPRSSRGWGP